MSDVTVTGWGRTNPARALLVECDHQSDVELVISNASQRGVLVRGLGRSYGDAAQVSGGQLVKLTGRNILLDPTSGVVIVDAGLSIDELLRYIVPKGWFVPVTPGTRYVTIGGAIAADIHGKNHHSDGSIGQWVESLNLVTAVDSLISVSPASDPHLFWATIGGMGLTGVIMSAQIKLIPIETPMMEVTTRRYNGIERVMVAMMSHDADHRYSVAWVDTTVSGGRLGRGVVTWGDHASSERLSVGRGRRFEKYMASQRLSVPEFAGSRRAIRRWNAVAFSELWFRSAPRERTDELQSIPKFFHPLDAVGNWNRLYGRRGFVQYQFVVPEDRPDVVVDALRRVASERPADFLNVLKRFGDAGDGMLSFPMRGWTLTMDLPVTDGLSQLVHHLDELVMEAGGRIYLAKDGCSSPRVVAAGYPRLDEWRNVRSRVDPNGIFQSDLSRRLEL